MENNSIPSHQQKRAMWGTNAKEHGMVPAEMKIIPNNFFWSKHLHTTARRPIPKGLVWNSARKSRNVLNGTGQRGGTYSLHMTVQQAANVWKGCARRKDIMSDVSIPSIKVTVPSSVAISDFSLMKQRDGEKSLTHVAGLGFEEVTSSILIWFNSS